jgi:hypothetical protein
MASLTRVEQDALDRYLADGGQVRVIPQVIYFAALPMVPRRGGKGASSRFGRGRRELADRVSIPDPGVKPELV